MATLLISMLEEEAKGASLRPTKRFRRAADSLTDPHLAADDVSSGSQPLEPGRKPPWPPQPGGANASNSSAAEEPLRQPAPQSTPRPARKLFSNRSKIEGNPFTAALPEAGGPRSETTQSVTLKSKPCRHEESCKENSSSEKGNSAVVPLKKRVTKEFGNFDRQSDSSSKAQVSGDLSAPPQRSGSEGPSPKQKASPVISSGGKSSKSFHEHLPVWKFRDELREKVEKHQVTLVIGETGSGKTTQVPQLLLQWGLCPGGWIGVSQPRRVAAVSLARRVSAEMGEAEVGGLVGYSVRFETKLSRRTRICFMTDGMMVREAIIDSKMKRFSALVLDEVHERALQTDFLLGLTKVLAERRPAVKVVLMSATMETEKLKRFFPDAAVVSIPGSTFPLRTLFVCDPLEDFLEGAMLAVLKIHLGSAEKGDVLVFLPGQEEIETLGLMLRSKLQLLEAFVSKHQEQFGEGAEFSVRIGDEIYRHRRLQRLLICPIYAALPFDKQQQVLLPAPPQYSRKAVLATNIAETSLTVSGIRFVVDTGLCKAKARDHRTLTEALILQEISQDSVKQRGGRAGREAPGTVYRLYTEECFHKMQPHKTPEILSCDLSQLFLQLKVLGVKNPLEFPFLDNPPREAFAAAGRQLYRLEAIDDRGEITPLGRQLALLPLPPQLGALLLAAGSMNCQEEALTLTAMLSSENVWTTPFNLSRGAATALSKVRKRFTDPQSDHLTLVGAYNHWARADDPYVFCKEAGLQHSAMLRARAIRQQLQDVLSSMGVRTAREPSSLSGDAQDQQQQVVNLRRCLARSCWQQAARLQPETREFVTAEAWEDVCVQVHRQKAKVHPTSVLCGSTKLPQWVIYSELVHTSKAYIRCVTAIEASWLNELAPKWFTSLRA